MTRISVVIPVHNAREDLPRCLSSLMAQLSGEDEILLIEDSSTDGSDALCDSYAAQHPQIQCFHVRFGGPSPTRNYGLRHAKGQYILFVDSDDWVDGQAVQLLLDRAEDHELVVGGYYFETAAAVTEKRLAGKTALPKEQVLTLYQTELLNVLWNKLFRGDIIRKNGIAFDENLKKGEDLLFILQYLHHVQTPIAIIDRCIYHYISKDTGINRSHKETMDQKRDRTLQMIEAFHLLVTDKTRLTQQMLNLYFRHIRDYAAGENAGKLRLIRREARHDIVKQILGLDKSMKIRLLRGLHLCHLDLSMFLANKLLLK